MHLLLCFNTSFYILLLMMAMFTYLCMYVINKLGESCLDSLSVKLSFIWLFGNFSQCQVVISYILNIY